MKKFFGHLKIVIKHKTKVFILCIRAGIPWRGFVHDLSKFSHSEFFEGVKYFNGKKSPNSFSIKENGFSKAWNHHYGRNKHHHEYWYDYTAIDKTPVIPYKYVAEMICDMLAAGMTYNGKDWTTDTQLEYYEARRHKFHINKKIDKLLMDVFTQVSKNGVNATITSKNLKNLYKKYVN